MGLESYIPNIHEFVPNHLQKNPNFKMFLDILNLTFTGETEKTKIISDALNDIFNRYEDFQSLSHDYKLQIIKSSGATYIYSLFEHTDYDLSNIIPLLSVINVYKGDPFGLALILRILNIEHEVKYWEDPDAHLPKYTATLKMDVTGFENFEIFRGFADFISSYMLPLFSITIEVLIPEMGGPTFGNHAILSYVGSIPSSHYTNSGTASRIVGIQQGVYLNAPADLDVSFAAPIIENYWTYYVDINCDVEIFIMYKGEKYIVEERYCRVGRTYTVPTIGLPFIDSYYLHIEPVNKTYIKAPVIKVNIIEDVTNACTQAWAHTLITRSTIGATPKLTVTN